MPTLTVLDLAYRACVRESTEILIPDGEVDNREVPGDGHAIPALGPGESVGQTMRSGAGSASSPAA